MNLGLNSDENCLIIVVNYHSIHVMLAGFMKSHRSWGFNHHGMHPSCWLEDRVQSPRLRLWFNPPPSSRAPEIAPEVVGKNDRTHRLPQPLAAMREVLGARNTWEIPWFFAALNRGFFHGNSIRKYLYQCYGWVPEGTLFFALQNEWFRN